VLPDAPPTLGFDPSLPLPLLPLGRPTGFVGRAAVGAVGPVAMNFKVFAASESFPASEVESSGPGFVSESRLILLQPPNEAALSLSELLATA
jgi:hypothetical protein